MKLEPRSYDRIWMLALLFGGCAAWLYGHPVPNAVWLAPFLLLIGLAAAGFLSLCVTRQEGVTHKMIASQVTPVNCKSSPAWEELVEFEAVTSAVKATHSIFHEVDLMESYKSLHSQHLHSNRLIGGWSSAVLIEGILTSYESESIRRRKERMNLLEDAVHIAKQLRGTGLQVAITREDQILVTDPTPLDQTLSLEADDGEGKAARSNRNEYVN